MSTTSASRIVLGLCAFASSVTFVGTACVGSDASPVVVVSGDGAASEMPSGPDAGGDERLPAVGGPGTGGDGGGAVDATVAVDAAGPWTPARIAGLALWLDGDTAVADVNGRVATWTDKSGAGNDATTVTDVQKPVLLTGADGLNAHHALHFDGTGAFMTIADKASLRWTQSFVIETVFRRIEAKLAPIFWKLTSDAIPKGVAVTMGSAQINPSTYKPFVRVVLGANPYVEDTYVLAPFPEGVPHRLRAAWNVSTNTLSIQLDKGGTASGVQTGVMGNDAVGYDAIIGSGPSGGYVKADIAEIVAIAGATVDPADILMLQSYLDAKYGL